MRGGNFSIGLTAVLAIFTGTLLVTATVAAAQQESVLYSFNTYNGTGVGPVGLISDTGGNLYGTTALGGSGTCSLRNGDGCGTVFELSPATGGGWTETILYNFSNNGTDGYAPGGLIFDASGNLYGTTFLGGTGVCKNNTSCGTVFELSPTAGGGWTETILHNFGGTDGFGPNAGLIVDASGNLYGTTLYGGTGTCPMVGYACGTVFELLPKAGGSWTEKVLHSFNDNGKDGFSPVSGVIFDTVGNLYGTTNRGGIDGHGTVFKLAPKTGGGWMEQVLHSFAGGKDGYGPLAGLTLDASGNLYGTTAQGGTGTRCGLLGCGTIFELTPTVSGGWTEKVLHNFGKGSDGLSPRGLTIDAVGNLYGPTLGGGTGTPCTLGCGTVFQLSPKAGGGWTEKVLHSFNDNGTDGTLPTGILVLDAAGDLYGTTGDGGAYGGGAMYEITP